MANILVSNNVYMPTSQACVVDTTPPTFTGIATISAQLNGSILATWLAATDTSLPIYYDVYIQAGTSVGLFSSSNISISTNKLSVYLFTLADNSLLVSGQTYFVGIRARDPLGNQSTTLTSLSALSQGVNPTRTLTVADIGLIVDGVWDELQSAHTTPGTFGKYLDIEVGSRATQTSITALDSKLGTPAGVSVSADIAAVKVDTSSIDSKVDVNVSTRASQASVDAVPTAAENADAVWTENVNDHATGTTTARTLKDAKIFSQIDI